MSILDIKNLSIEYQGGTMAIKDISMSVNEGEIIINGTNFWKLDKKGKREFHKKVQMVYQDPLSSFSPRMKIGEYICEPRINYDKINKELAREEAIELLKAVDLPKEFMDRYPHQLSGGQLQRVAIARALAISPEILICDEATSALDVSIQKQILELFHKIQKEKNLTCLFICHDLAVVNSITDKVIVMYKGELVEEIETQFLITSPKQEYTKLLLNSSFDIYCDQNKEISLIEVL
ncbi:MAG: hypothetical protein BEN19_01255 [Epulopiscium sp. Nuni2H_MBin003]|nr:MAG: hypothetical protein BEN19_01255 [Epulopiscium sp. Nuni2H_MBin003]